MGIGGCTSGKVLWKAKELTLKSLKDMTVGNRVDVDGNALAYKLAAGKEIPKVVDVQKA